MGAVAEKLRRVLLLRERAHRQDAVAVDEMRGIRGNGSVGKSSVTTKRARLMTSRPGSKRYCTSAAASALMAAPARDASVRGVSDGSSRYSATITGSRCVRPRARA